MRRSAIRYLILTICATAVVVAPLVTATGGEAGSRHLQKHHARTHHGLKNAMASDVRPVAPSWSGGGDVCPGGSRSFDCKIWPPPFGDDPDRKGTDGGP